MFSTIRPLLLGAALITASGCGDSGRIQVPPFDPATAGQQAIAEYDTNKDGVLDDAELDRCPGLKQGLKLIDKNGDGKLSADEIRDRVLQYFEDKVALFPLTVIVTLDGKALDGATVTLVPEAFMGPSVKPVRGTTDTGGSCSFLAEGQTIRGVYPGVYRVEVSKKDADGKETVPEKYNAKTTLGFELGGGNELQRAPFLAVLKSK
jgi:hypothetical protein